MAYVLYGALITVLLGILDNLFTSHTFYTQYNFNGSNINYENTPIQIYRKFHLQKTENFQIKNSDIFHISAQNIECGYWLEPPRQCGSNEYPQSLFLSRNKKNNAYPCKPQFYYIKMRFKRSKLYRHVLVMADSFTEAGSNSFT